MGGTNSQQAIVNEMNDMSATAITNILLTCRVGAIGNQTITLSCNPIEDVGNFADNKACVKSVETIFKKYTDDLQNTIDQVKKGSSNFKAIDDYKAGLAKELHDLGTIGLCKACQFTDVSQILQIDAQGTCQARNNIKNELNQQLTATVSQSAKSHRDFLAPIAQALGASTDAIAIATVANRMNSLITEDVVNNAIETLTQNQTITVNSEGKSGGIHQYAALQGVQNYFANTDIMNRVFEKAEWKTIETLSNEQSTLGELGDATAKSVGLLAKMVKSTMGKVVFFVWAITLITFAFLAVYFVVKQIQKGWEHAEQRKFRKELGVNQTTATAEAF